MIFISFILIRLNYYILAKWNIYFSMGDTIDNCHLIMYNERRFTHISWSAKFLVNWELKLKPHMVIQTLCSTFGTSRPYVTKGQFWQWKDPVAPHMLYTTFFVILITKYCSQKVVGEIYAWWGNSVSTAWWLVIWWEKSWKLPLLIITFAIVMIYIVIIRSVGMFVLKETLCRQCIYCVHFCLFVLFF